MLKSILALILLAQPALAAQVWFEAESPSATNFPPRHAFTPANAHEADVLSEGKWIGVDGNRAQVMFLEYKVTVPAAGRYSFYARKFWKHGPFRWRFGNQPWQMVGKDVALLDSVEMRQFVGANWVSAGQVELAAGEQTLRIELTEQSGAACFDCFLLTTSPFSPNGKLKPGQKLNRAPDGWFAFEPDEDPYAASPIDLRPLNEKFAGENGFIQVKGESFIHSQTGRPVRFWAVNTGHDAVQMDKSSVDAFAKFLAKRGVNIIRVHGGPWKRDDLTKIDEKYLDHLHYFIAAMKKEGVYTCLSIYFPLWLDLKPADVFEGYNSKHPFALLFFDPQFQAIYKTWWTALLTTKNPYTGVPLNMEPALAMAEIINEDSYFFWTFKPYDAVPEPQIVKLEKQFGQWLAAKHGSLDKAMASWGGRAIKGDDRAAGRAGFMNLWEIANVKNKRAQDTARFLTESQTRFFTEMTAFLKNDLKFKGSVYGSNWTTADARILGPLDKYSNTVCDFMDRHGYYSGVHEGPRSAYALSAGDKYDDRCALLFEAGKKGETSFSLPIMDIAYNGKPSIISEVNWPPPTRYRADLPLLLAAYGTLQGSDGSFFFATGTASWQQTVTKFAIATPVTMGQFPATALMYRKGLIQPAKPVATINLNLDDLYALKGAPVTAPQNLDEFRAKDIPAGQAMQTETVSALDPLAFLVGRVEMNIGESARPSMVMDLSKHIDRTKKVVRSITGELAWDYGTGLVTVNAPQAQGAAGFLAKAGRIELADLAIESPMEYGCILVVALDDQPLKTSGRILLQVMSEDNNYGWTAPGSGLRTIQSLGAPPLVVRNLAGTVSLKRTDAATLRVTPLDFNGYKTESRTGAGSIVLEAKTVYYIVER